MARIFDLYVNGEKQDMGDINIALEGYEEIGLYPDMFMLRLKNVSDNVRLSAGHGNRIEVKSNGSCLAFGDIHEIYKRPISNGFETVITFANGFDFWNQYISCSYESGKMLTWIVNDMLQQVANNGGPLYNLVNGSGMDLEFGSSMAFSDRAAVCIERILSAVDAVGNLGLDYLMINPKNGSNINIEFRREDLCDVPYFTNNKWLILSTVPKGWQVGSKISLEYEGNFYKGVLVRRSLDLDNTKKPWKTELLVAMK